MVDTGQVPLETVAFGDAPVAWAVPHGITDLDGGKDEHDEHAKNDEHKEGKSNTQG